MTAAVVPHYKLDSVEVLAIGCLAVVLGIWLKRKIELLNKLCIPASIAGGLVFALIALALHGRWLDLEFDTTLRDLFMIAFMTTIGLSARWTLIRRGGMPVILLLMVSTVGAMLQNLLGIGLAHLLHVPPLFGIVTGSVALTGGPATAVAFGSTFEKLGLTGAMETGLAAATFGIAIAGLVAGYAGKWLIVRHRLSAPASGVKVAAPSLSDSLAEADDRVSAATLLSTVLLIGVAMGLGGLISMLLTRSGAILPSYIGAMIAAALIRNLNDRNGWISISQAAVDQCALIALYLFIAIAVCSLALWQLAHLVFPLLVILAAQVMFCWLMCVTACYWILGRNYRAAIVGSGFVGYMLGITANAIASMQELVERFGPCPEAFFIVPIVGAFLIDFCNALLITTMTNMFK